MRIFYFTLFFVVYIDEIGFGENDKENYLCSEQLMFYFCFCCRKSSLCFPELSGTPGGK